MCARARNARTWTAYEEKKRNNRISAFSVRNCFPSINSPFFHHSALNSCIAIILLRVMQSMIMIHIMCIVLRETFGEKKNEISMHFSAFNFRCTAKDRTKHSTITCTGRTTEKKKERKKKQIKFTTYCVNVLLCC